MHQFVESGRWQERYMTTWGWGAFGLGKRLVAKPMQYASINRAHAWIRFINEIIETQLNRQLHQLVRRMAHRIRSSQSHQANPFRKRQYPVAAKHSRRIRGASVLSQIQLAQFRRREIRQVPSDCVNDVLLLASIASHSAVGMDLRHAFFQLLLQNGYGKKPRREFQKR